MSADPTSSESTGETNGLDDDIILNEELNAQDLEQAQRALEDARARLADIPAEVVVVNHAMGLYELAAIHLSAEPPRLAEAALAIDAVGCLVEGLGERLGPEFDTLSTALGNIRLAFVQVKGVTE
jgi:uncharacterized protein with GYD domain